MNPPSAIQMASLGLGEPAPDVGTAMTYKILKSNGWMVHRGTVRVWTPEDIANPALQKRQDNFMAAIHSHMGRAAESTDFPEADLTPDFPYNADDDEDCFTGNPDEVEDVEIPTPEAQDNYVDVSLALPFGDGLAQGKVTKRARDNDGNVIGRAHDNPILDTRKYKLSLQTGRRLSYQPTPSRRACMLGATLKVTSMFYLTLLLIIEGVLQP